MYRKLPYLIILMSVILAAMSGCISLQFETQLNQENNVEIKFETPTGLTELQELTATSQVATGTSGLMISETPTAVPASILLSDNFDDAANRAGFDRNLWTCEGCSIGNTTYESDSIRFEINGIGVINIASISSFPSNQIGSVQARLKLGEYEGGDNGDVHLSLRTEVAAGFWQAVCWVAGRAEPIGQPIFQCAVEITSDSNEENYQYVSNGITVNYYEWHTTKIELNPETLEVRFYFDDKLIGGYTSKEADELRGKYLRALVGITSGNTRRHVVAYADDMLVLSSSPAPQTVQQGGSPIVSSGSFATPVVEDSVLKFSDEFQGVSYGLAKWGNVLSKNGNIELSQSPSGGSGMTLQNGLSEGMGMVFLLKYTEREFNVYLANKASYWDTYVGLNISPGYRVQTAVSVRNKFIGGESLDGNLSLSAEHWYFVMIKILNGGAFYIRIWDKDNSSKYREAGVRLGNEWAGQTWYPTMTVNTGQVTVDYYQELEFYKPAVPTPSPTEELNWAVSFEYSFPSGFWTLGSHEYTLEANCPNLKDGSGSWTKTFEVSTDATPLPGNVYLRLSGLRDAPLAGANAVSKIHPSQATVAYFSLIDATRAEMELAFNDCQVTVKWDGGVPQAMTRGEPFQRQ